MKSIWKKKNFGDVGKPIVIGRASSIDTFVTHCLDALIIELVIVTLVYNEIEFMK